MQSSNSLLSLLGYMLIGVLGSMGTSDKLRRPTTLAT
jgi:hypothetical protein